ncbi:low molecular weight phosphotyrosine protein phosphatase [Gammaproteobacteria bacterium LSUCC0112]|nr:low molecular weight phosphotyrosine protein phosphatase [Gammaproteobacteria bacterium LSUCC0112]
MSPSPYQHILVVCLGNICRSPVAEAMLKQALPQRQIKSAGLTAMVGQGADATAAEIAKNDGLDLSGHNATQLSSEMIQWADLILVMSQNQRSAIGEKNPAALGKTMLLGHWLPASGKGAGNSQTQQKDIPDPYKKSREVFEHVHKLIHQSVSEWSKKI